MIDRDLIDEMSYQDFAPVFRDMERVFQKLDALEIRSIVGDRPVDQLEDKFIRLVLATFRTLESPVDPILDAERCIYPVFAPQTPSKEPIQGASLADLSPAARQSCRRNSSRNSTEPDGSGEESKATAGPSA